VGVLWKEGGGAAVSQGGGVLGVKLKAKNQGFCS
jgi:hypothetical protein